MVWGGGGGQTEIIYSSLWVVKNFYVKSMGGELKVWIENFFVNIYRIELGKSAGKLIYKMFSVV